MLTELRLSDFRNYHQADFSPSSGLNLIFGANGSGKTSLLEAIYFIGSGGRSFRGGRLSRLVRDGASSATLFAVVDQPSGKQDRLGVRRALSGIESLKLNGQTPSALSDVATLLPVLALHPQSVDLIFGASSVRRRFLDWGMFHVEHSFLAAWKEANSLLKQRNALLRAGKASQKELRYWDQKLAASSATIEGLRRPYLARLKTEWRKILEMLSPDLKVNLELHNGLRPGEDYLQALIRTEEEDRRRGFTHAGFHRADVRITKDGVVARDRVSRGQAKILSYALVLSQLPMISEANKVCTLLVDDLGSELDQTHRDTLLRFLTMGNHQTLITAVDADHLGRATVENSGAAARMFHVEHGRIQRISNDS